MLWARYSAIGTPGWNTRLHGPTTTFNEMFGSQILQWFLLGWVCWNRPDFHLLQFVAFVSRKIIHNDRRLGPGWFSDKTTWMGDSLHSCILLVRLVNSSTLRCFQWVVLGVAPSFFFGKRLRLMEEKKDDTQESTPQSMSVWSKNSDKKCRISAEWPEICIKKSTWNASIKGNCIVIHTKKHFDIPHPSNYYVQVFTGLTGGTFGNLL